MKQTILVVDDEPSILFSISNYLNHKGYLTFTAPTIGEAQKTVMSDTVDAVILDMHLPDGNGIDWIPFLRSRFPALAIIVITGEGDVPLAVKAMQNGADHFTTKPVKLNDLTIFLNKSLEIRSLRRTAISSRRLKKIVQPYWGEGQDMQKVRKLVNIACGSEVPVLLMGETGTGKGVLANWIHEQSQRKQDSFVEINCTSLRGELLVSELFGHRKGAFTSAIEDKPGLIEVAGGGTLFLDEIGDMDLEIQTQFLKVLEEKQFRHLGDTKTIKSDFRLICATNRDLALEVKQGSFRQDLFYRIHVFPIQLPPLRNRKEDITLIASEVLSQMGYQDVVLSKEVTRTFQSYTWPGNIRELRNVLERAVLLTEDNELLPEHLFGLSTAVPESADNQNSLNLADMESGHIQKVLLLTGRDTQKAAGLLGISRASLYRKMNKYKLNTP
ncbi:sigma-54-dependent Fis family transcriptional regulator [bacterium]|nr:sigma-54-dependent Fis family transcriptional regulator [bacterium]